MYLAGLRPLLIMPRYHKPCHYRPRDHSNFLGEIAAEWKIIRVALNSVGNKPGMMAWVVIINDESRDQT